MHLLALEAGVMSVTMLAMMVPDGLESRIKRVAELVDQYGKY